MLYIDMKCTKCDKEYYDVSTKDMLGKKCTCGGKLERLYLKASVFTHFKGSHNYEYNNKGRNGRR